MSVLTTNRTRTHRASQSGRELVRLLKFENAIGNSGFARLQTDASKAALEAVKERMGSIDRKMFSNPARGQV